MKSCFRIFKLLAVEGQMCLKEAVMEDKQVFKYHDGKGDFKSYTDAHIWLHGLSTLRGQFVILEVFEKKH